MLHRVVRDHLQSFLWELDRREHERGAPLFVKREFQRFVRCGVLAHGFARFRCTDCGTARFPKGNEIVLRLCYPRDLGAQL